MEEARRAAIFSEVDGLQQAQAKEVVNDAEPGVVVAGFGVSAEFEKIFRRQRAQPWQRYRIGRQ